MLLRITALAVVAGAAAAPSPALRVTALAAVTTAAAPPFITSKELRPAARRVQDFAECPVLTKIKKDDCGDVKDFEALPVCSDACLCKLCGNQIYGAFVLPRDVRLLQGSIFRSGSIPCVHAIAGQGATGKTSERHSIEPRHERCCLLKRSQAIEPGAVFLG